MVILNRKEVPIIDKRGFTYKNKKKIILILKCDGCGLVYENKHPNIKKPESRKVHYCSVKCLTSSDITINKRKKTCTDRYGVDVPMKSDFFLEKRKKMCLEKYGCASPMQNDNVKTKTKNTCIETYGVEYYLQSQDKKNKSKKTCLEKYGVEIPSKNDKIKEKAKNTCIEKYGVSSACKVEKFKEKMKQTCLEKYGVEHAMKLPETNMKRHLTMKNNGSYGNRSSKIENKFFQKLCDYFGHDNVENHIIINNWCIDFHLTKLNIYIQFDGVYWHGLNRDLEIIKNSLNITDKSIIRTYLSDRKQDSWFKENNLVLVRITDEQFKKNNWKSILKIIKRYS